MRRDLAMAEIGPLTITLPGGMVALVKGDERMADFEENQAGEVGSHATDVRFRALRHFFDVVSQMPVKDARSIDEIVGYRPDGLPEP